MRANKRQLMIALSIGLLGAPMFTAITVQNIPLPVSTPAAKQYTVYLTFDDGPSANTDKVLDVLLEEDVPATFFVIGVTNESGIERYNRIIAEGHSLGLHSYSHDMQGIYRSLKSFTSDFTRLERWVLENTGASVRVCRMVGGSHSIYCPAIIREEILTYLIEQGYSCYDWDIDAKDSGAHALPAWLLAKNIIQAANKKPNQDLIILMHDDALRTTIADALEIIIPHFKERGYAFDVLQEDNESTKKILPKQLMEMAVGDAVGLS